MQNRYSRAFTIVELLVVIVVIGILAVITIVSYTGITRQAIVASLQSDLDNSYKKIKLFEYLILKNKKFSKTLDSLSIQKLARHYGIFVQCSE